MEVGQHNTNRANPVCKRNTNMEVDTSSATTWKVVSIIKEECGKLGYPAEEALICCTLKMIYDNPRNGFDNEVAMDRHSVRRLIGACVHKITHDAGPVMETMRMQVLFNATFAPSADWILEYRRELEAKMGPLSREIVETQVTSKAGLDALYSKLVTTVVLRSGLGNPTSNKVLREATAGLQSIFPPMSLLKFMQQGRIDKQAQIRELAHIVAGIRIFNWDAKRGGAGIEDLPGIMSASVESTLKHLSNLSIVTAEKAHQLTALTEKLLYTEMGSRAATENDVDAIKYGLVNIRQFQIDLGLISKEVSNCGHRLSTLDQDLLKHLTDLQHTIGSQLAVPSANVYPQFVRLALTWQGFQEEMVVLAQLNALIRALHAHTKCQAKLPTTRLEHELYDASVPSDDERNELSSQGTIQTDEFECQLVCPGDVENYDAVPLEYAGFCPVALVSGQGFVLPGNRRIGYLRYEGKFYSPSTVDRAEQFGRNPRMFLRAIKKLTSENPCLLSLLNIQYFDDDPNFPLTCPKQERSSQTLTHVLESFRDPDYRWNEWDMRKEALKMAHAKKATVKSVQTEEGECKSTSYTKLPVGIQATAPPAKSVQATKIDASTTTGFTKSFILGLQGETSFPIEHLVLDELSCNT